MRHYSLFSTIVRILICSQLDDMIVEKEMTAMAIFAPALSVLIFLFAGPQTILGAIVGFCAIQSPPIKHQKLAKGLLIATLVLGIVLTVIPFGLLTAAFI